MEKNHKEKRNKERKYKEKNIKRNNKVKGRKKKTGLPAAPYACCAVCLLAVIAAALLLPQAVFAVQDNYQVNNTVREKRDSMGLANLNLSYEKNLKNRMTAFAKGLAEGKSFHVTSTDYELGDELGYLQDALVRNERMLYYIIWDFLTLSEEMLYDSDYLSEILDGEAECRRYIIYDEDYSNGIAFSCLYMNLPLSEGRRIQALMDTEDHTIYYLKIFCTWDRFYHYSVKKYGPSAASLYDDKDERFYSKINPQYVDMLFDSMGGTAVLSYTGGKYWAADIPIGEQEFYAYVEEQWASATVVGAAELESFLDSPGYGKALSIQLPYGDYSLNCGHRVYQPKDDTACFVMALGIEELGRLVPELDVE